MIMNSLIAQLLVTKHCQWRLSINRDITYCILYFSCCDQITSQEMTYGRKGLSWLNIKDTGPPYPCRHGGRCMPQCSRPQGRSVMDHEGQTGQGAWPTCTPYGPLSYFVHQTSTPKDSTASLQSTKCSNTGGSVAHVTINPKYVLHSWWWQS